MADFTVQDGFNKDKNFSQVKFGQDAPLLETELNELQKIQMEAKADIVRKSIHSGFLEMSDLEFIKATVNYFQFKNEQTVNVDGHFITIPAKTAITMPEAPTTGYREDLVFLEAWFEEISGERDSTIKDNRIGVETSRRVKLNWRIRAEAGVDFETYKADGFHYGTNNTMDASYSKALAQGSNKESVEHLTDSKKTVGFSNYLSRASLTQPRLSDVGLYVAGRGNANSKNLLGTEDGFVYAIPLFRVKRRNSSSYSSVNGNGSTKYRRVYGIVVDNAVSLIPGDIGVITLRPAQSSDLTYPLLKVGDYLENEESNYWKLEVLEILGENRLKVRNVGNSSWSQSSSHWYAYSKRPDNLFSDIVVERDIIDLRHKVSLTGINLDQILQDNFDRLIRGELQTTSKIELLKTYHGIPKTPVDENTIFYASLDGNTKTDKGVETALKGTYKNVPTGLGLSLTESTMQHPLPNFNRDFLSISMWLDVSKSGVGQILSIFNEQGYYTFSVFYDTTRRVAIQVLAGDGTNSSQQFTGSVNKENYLKMTHYRFEWDWEAKTMRIYADGKLDVSLAWTLPIVGNTFTLGLGNKRQFSSTDGYSTNAVLPFTISDVSISNKKRDFGDLPKDYVDGYARISPSFNKQRKIFSDAEISQNTFSIAQPFEKVSDSGVKVIKSLDKTNEAIWEAGDKIEVRGITGEFIGNLKNPTVKFVTNNLQTIEPKDVTGTWSGLGTNKAEFTLGENIGLISENLVINYELLIAGGRGGIPEILTKVVSGEFKGNNLVSGKPTTKANFLDKVNGDIVTNPHIARVAHGLIELLEPHKGSEWSNGYSDFMVQSDIRAATSDGRDIIGGLGQMVFSFNLISHLEMKYGKSIFKDCLNLTQKIDKAKTLLSKLTFNWWGFGRSGTDYKATISRWISNSGGQWQSGAGTIVSTRDSYINSTKLSASSDIGAMIQPDGFVHFIAYSEPTIDKETPARLSTHYTELEVELKGRDGYTVLSTENPYADKSAVLFVHGATKSIESLTDLDENSGVVSYVNYLPYQGKDGMSLSTKVIGSKPYAPFVLITTEGSGRLKTLTGSDVFPSDVYLNIANKLHGRNSFELIGQDIHGGASGNEESIPMYGRYPIISETPRTGSDGIFSGSNATRFSYNVKFLILGNLTFSGKALIALPYLLTIEDEVYLVIKTTIRDFTGNDLTIGATPQLFRLYGNPLIKGVN